MTPSDSERLRAFPSSGTGLPFVAVALVVGFGLLLLHRDPHFFWNDDYQVVFLPNFYDMARAWEAGEPPLISPFSWYGGAFAGEYRYGTFSLWIHLLVVGMWRLKLSLPATAALFAIIHLAVLAAGSPFTAVMIGLVTLLLALRTGFERRRLLTLWPLLGAWAWGVALASPALLMLVEHLRSGARGGHLGLLQWQWVVPPAGLLGLIAPSFPSEWFAWEGRVTRPAVELACGLLPPVLLGAALLRLRRAFVRAYRWELAALGFALLLVLLPSIAPFRYSFRWLPLFHLVLALLAARALASLRADEARSVAARRVTSFDLVGAALGLLILEKIVTFLIYGLYAYIDFGFQAALLVVALAVMFPVWLWLRRTAVPSGLVVRWSPCLVACVALWSTYSTVPTRFVNRWDFGESLRRAAPLDAEILYLSLYDRDEAYRSDPGLSRLIRPGNTGMFAGVHLVNGYSTIGPAGLARALRLSHLGFTSDSAARRLLERDAGPEGLLQLLGVDGLVLSQSRRGFAPGLLERGWETAFSSEKGVVLHRVRRSPEVRCLPSAEPVPSADEIALRLAQRSSRRAPVLLVRSDAPPPEGPVEYSPCRLTLLKDTRLAAEVRVETPASGQPALVVFSRAWYPGYRATLEGRELEVRALDLILPAVEIPAGAAGLLVLEYAPTGLRAGLVVSFLALILGAVVAAASRRRRRPASRIERGERLPEDGPRTV